MRTAQNNRFDILIAGAGPAGASAAIELTRRGHRVAIAEMSAFPRPHIGSSVQHAARMLLQRLGLWERARQEGIIRNARARIHWQGAATDTRSSNAGETFLADRARLDQLMLSKAIAAGATLFPRHRLKSYHRTNARFWTSTLVDWQGRHTVLVAQILILATGRRGLLAGTRRRIGPPTLALHGRWSSTGIDLDDTIIAACDRHWYWAAPVPDGSINVAAFLDPADAGLSRTQTVETRLCQLFQDCRPLRAMFRSAPLHKAQACDASRLITQLTANAPIIIGDAGFTVDPLSSQGVVHALASGFHGAAAANTILENPDKAQVAQDFLSQRRVEITENDLMISQNYYAQAADRIGQAFWRRRAGDAINPSNVPDLNPTMVQPPQDDDLLTLASTARLEPVPTLDGWVIKERPALCARQLSRPVTFFEEIAVELLLDPLREGRGLTPARLKQIWQAHISPDRAEKLLRSLLSRRILVVSKVAH